MGLTLTHDEAMKLLRRAKVPRAVLDSLRDSKPTRTPKFRAHRTEALGRTFDSAGEANRYGELLMLQRAGEIFDLVCQFPFELNALNVVTGELIRIGEWRADFVYQDRAGRRVIEDYKKKQTRTAIYRWKKKHVEAQYRVTIIEVGV